MTDLISTSASPSVSPVLDISAIKSRQQATWASGAYGKIGVTLQLVGELLCEAVDVGPGDRVLDVAAGNGNAALAAARRGAAVLASDYVPALLDAARRRADAEGLALATEVADAEALPSPDAAFDVVLSTFGVMFTPSQEAAAAELARVCRRGGRIGLASWVPDGFIGELLRTIGRYVPPPAGVRSPSLWGTEARIRELFGERARIVTATRRTFLFRYPSAAHFVAFFRAWYGPTLKAFGALSPERQAELALEIVALARQHDRGDGRRLVAASDYLEVVLERR
ncbi:MAG TPA: class I SAM-dependent methyltransferase [Kofleriaceae bacterium]|nr:class I SAM-dependent methyltransferase [Kofleriaceae bacterium]